jgi:hypothetical protein
MTNPTKRAGCPKKVWLQHEGGGTLSSRYNFKQVNSNDIEYIRADLVKNSHRVHQIAEAARCLGVAQTKNDSEAIKYWTSKVDELTNSDLVKPIKKEPVAQVDANDDEIWADILPDSDVKVGQFLYSEDTVRVLQLEAIRKTLEVASNKAAELRKMFGVNGLFIAEQIARIEPEEILNILGELKCF